MPDFPNSIEIPVCQCNVSVARASNNDVLIEATGTPRKTSDIMELLAIELTARARNYTVHRQENVITVSTDGDIPQELTSSLMPTISGYCEGIFRGIDGTATLARKLAEARAKLPKDKAPDRP